MRRSTAGRRPLPWRTSIAIALMLGACRQPRLPGGGVPRPESTPATASAGCEPGQYLEETFPDVQMTKDLVYSRVSDRFGSHVLKMDVYEAGHEAASRRPAIVWLFGGNFVSGDRRQLGEFATAFAARGYFAAAIDYRLQHKEGVPTAQAAEAAQSDAQAAIRFLRARADEFALDPDRIAVAGFSAGSITAFNVAYRGEFLGDNMEHPGVSHSVGAVVGLDGFSAIGDLQPNDPPFILFRAGVAAHDDAGALPRLLEGAEAARIAYHVQVVKRARHQDLVKAPHSRAIISRAASFLRQHFACR